RADRLLVLLAGIAQLHAHVDQAWRQAAAAAIDDLDAVRHAVGEQARPEIGDLRALRQQRPRHVEPAIRIEQTRIDVGDARAAALWRGGHQLSRSAAAGRLRARISSTAMRTAT